MKPILPARPLPAVDPVVNAWIQRAVDKTKANQVAVALSKKIVTSHQEHEKRLAEKKQAQKEERKAERAAKKLVAQSVKQADKILQTSNKSTQISTPKEEKDEHIRIEFLSQNGVGKICNKCNEPLGAGDCLACRAAGEKEGNLTVLSLDSGKKALETAVQFLEAKEALSVKFSSGVVLTCSEADGTMVSRKWYKFAAAAHNSGVNFLAENPSGKIRVSDTLTRSQVVEGWTAPKRDAYKRRSTQVCKTANYNRNPEHWGKASQDVAYFSRG